MTPSIFTVMALTKIVRDDDHRFWLLKDMALEFGRRGQKEAASLVLRQIVTDFIMENENAPLAVLGSNRFDTDKPLPELVKMITSADRQNRALTVIADVDAPPELDYYTSSTLDEDLDDTFDDDWPTKTTEGLLHWIIKNPGPPQAIFPHMEAANVMRAKARQAIRTGDSITAIAWLSVGLAAIDEERQVAFGDSPESLEAFSVALVELAEKLSSEQLRLII